MEHDLGVLAVRPELGLKNLADRRCRLPAFPDAVDWVPVRVPSSVLPSKPTPHGVPARRGGGPGKLGPPPCQAQTTARPPGARRRPHSRNKASSSESADKSGRSRPSPGQPRKSRQDQARPDKDRQAQDSPDKPSAAQTRQTQSRYIQVSLAKPTHACRQAQAGPGNSRLGRVSTRQSVLACPC